MEWDRQIEVNGLRTHYLEAGEGRAIVLLHGADYGANAAICWEATIGPLAEHYRVVAPDLLGYGMSAKVVDFEDQRRLRLDHLSAFLRALDLGPHVLIGNSAGASIALEFACDPVAHPAIAGVVAVAGGGANPDNPARRLLSDYDGSIEAMRGIVGELFYDEALASDEYVSRRFEEGCRPGVWEVFAAPTLRRPGAPPAPRVRIQPEFERIAVPTLLVGGAEDRLKPFSELEELATRISYAELLRIEAARHYPQIEQAASFNEALLAFLGALFGRARRSGAHRSTGADLGAARPP